MPKTKKRNYTPLIYILAFFLPVFIGLICYYIRKIDPFGILTVNGIDAFGQYFPMLREAERNFFSGITYSFNGGLGFGTVAQSAYYTNSPIWILLYLFPGPITALEVDLSVIFRFGLMGLSMFHRLKTKYQKSFIPFLAVSTAWALSAYPLTFINQFMWMDTLILLPLVALGIERIVNGEKPWLYAISLALTIFCNFYTSWAVCIFCVIWFFVSLICKKSKKDSVQTKTRNTNGFKGVLISALIFAGASLCAGIVNLPVILPVLRTLSQTKASSLGFSLPLKFYIPFRDILKMLLPFQKRSLEYFKPNIYCGILFIPALICALFSKKIRIKNKLSYLFVMIFMLLSFNLNILDYFWHGLHYPNQLPARESFIFIFVVLDAAASGLAVLIPGKNAEKKPKIAVLKSAVAWTVCILALGDVTVNAISLINQAPCVTVDGLTSIQSTIDPILDLITPDYKKGEFFRVELKKYRDNGGMLYGYPGITYYSSTMSSDAYDFFINLGMPIYARNVSTRYSSSIPVDDLLSIRYILDENGELIENDDRLPLGFLCKEDILNVNMDYSGTMFIEDIFRKASGIQGKMIYPDRVIDHMYEAALDFLSSCPLCIDSIHQGIFGTRINGRIICDYNGILLLTLPASDAVITVDGEKAETLKLCGYLAGVKLDQGVHEITVKLR